MLRKINNNKKIPPKKTVIKPTLKTTVQKKPKKPAVKKEIKTAVTLGLHILKSPPGSHKHRKIKGRGTSSGHGKTSTRGSKGQTSRAGRDMYPGFEGGQTPLIRRIPKRGFTSKFKKEYQVLNLKDLFRIKETNLTLDLLESKGLIKDKTKLVKILGEGEVKNPVTVQAHAFSKSASDKIAKGGGKIELINA